MPAAEMTSGVTIGDSSRAVTGTRPGMAGFASPSAARTPRAVATAVAATPMTRLLPSARGQSSSATMPRYQRSDQASASRRNMPSVKVK